MMINCFVVKRLLYINVPVLLLVACQKQHEFTGLEEELVGSWAHSYSIVENGAFTETIWATELVESYDLNICRSGKVEFIRGGEIIKTRQVVEPQRPPNSPYSGQYVWNMTLNGKRENLICTLYDSDPDTLEVALIPFNFENGPVNFADTYTSNFFVRSD